MSTTTSSIASILNSLVETCKDGEQGFRAAADGVKDADLKAFFHEMSVQRGQFKNELQVLVNSLGEETEHSGSVMGSLHRGWIDIKAALTKGDDHAILEECERGEDSAVSEYREALGHDELPVEIRNVIERQYPAVQAAHDRVKTLRDRTAE